MNGLDGNAAAGMLFDVYGADMTTVVGRCESCGKVAALAEAAAYLRMESVVLRCTRCDSVLLVIVERPDVAVVDAHGIAL